MQTIEQIAAAGLQIGDEVTVTFDCYSHRRGESQITITALVVDVDAEALTLDAADEDGHEAIIEWDRITSCEAAAR